MLPTQLVPIIVKGDDGWRMLVALRTSQNKSTFINYLKEDLNASTDGDWYVVATNRAGDAAAQRVRELGGNFFSLIQGS